MTGGRYRRDRIAKPALAALIVLGATVGASPTPAPASTIAVTGSVSPRQVFLEGRPQTRVEVRVQAPAASDLVVRFTRGGREARRFQLTGVAPGERRLVRWDGMAGAGRPSADGKYVVTAGPPGEEGKRIGAVTLRGHIFPVRGSHGVRGAVGRFGASRNGGRVHEGFDIVAPCGRALRAARAGTVIRRGYDPRLYGNFVEVRGEGERLSYFYAHMVRPAEVKRGEEVGTGERVGRIGLTGNARGTPCHLHFEVHRRGLPINPERLLRRWDRFS